MAFSKLEQLGDKIKNLITRDAAQLQTYNVGPATAAAIESATQALKDMPTDEELKADVSYATAKRDESAEQVKTKIREIIVRPRIIYGEHSAEYRSFSIKGMDDMSMDELCRCGRRVVRRCNFYFDELEEHGLTQAEIDALENLVETFDVLIDKKDDAAIERDIATSKRVGLGNTLYTLITEVCDYGKTYWVSREEAKYNNYVIYNTPSQKKPEPGEFGAAHGTLYVENTTTVPANAQIFFEGVEVPILVNTDGTWQFDQIPIMAKKIRAEAENCKNYEADCIITADGDTEINIRMVEK